MYYICCGETFVTYFATKLQIKKRPVGRFSLEDDAISCAALRGH